MNFMEVLYVEKNYSCNLNYVAFSNCFHDDYVRRSLWPDKSDYYINRFRCNMRRQHIRKNYYDYYTEHRQFDDILQRTGSKE